jgi:hypothetical protein
MIVHANVLFAIYHFDGNIVDARVAFDIEQQFVVNRAQDRIEATFCKEKPFAKGISPIVFFFCYDLLGYFSDQLVIIPV